MQGENVIKFDRSMRIFSLKNNYAMIKSTLNINDLLCILFYKNTTEKCMSKQMNDFQILRYQKTIYITDQIQIILTSKWKQHLN